MFAQRRLAAALNRLASRGLSTLPRRTVRLRLTALYGGLFLLSGACLLTITYVVVDHSTRGTFFAVTRAGGPGEGLRAVVAGTPTQVTGLPVLPVKVAPEESARTVRIGGESAKAFRVGPGPVPSTQQMQAQAQRLTALGDKQHNSELHQLLVVSIVALAIMAVISVALGWLVSGRALRPLRTMTAATRRISEDNLHERLSLEGPDDELKDLADTIDGLLARLEAAFDAQRRFVANASHELRTPLAMMRTSLDVAVAKPGPLPPQIGVLEHKLREGLDRAERLLESFLTLARAQHGALSEQTTVSLSRIVFAAIRARAERIAEKGITVHEAIVNANLTGSEMLLSRMVDNVIENAVRHNERGGWMSVQSEISGAAARIVVESGGPILEQSAVAQLAQPFRRLGAERTGFQNGVGLGLSIVAAIAAAHGGTLELRARSEGGLRVQIELPCAPPSSATALASTPAHLAGAPS